MMRGCGFMFYFANKEIDRQYFKFLLFPNKMKKEKSPMSPLFCDACTEAKQTIHLSFFHKLTWIVFLTGLNAPVAECDPGFYCPGGNDVANPVETPCPIGLHCPQGSGKPKPCEPGSYANFSQAPSCLICPAGFYCVPEEVVQGENIFVFPQLVE